MISASEPFTIAALSGMAEPSNFSSIWSSTKLGYCSMSFGIESIEYVMMSQRPLARFSITSGTVSAGVAWVTSGIWSITVSYMVAA